MSLKILNVRSILNLEDMSLAIDYLIDRDAFESELQDIKEKIITKDNSRP